MTTLQKLIATGIIVVLGFIFGCKQPEIKKIVGKYDNGNPKFLIYFHSKTDTTSYRKEMYYESGKISYVGNFVHDIKDGVWTWWYENGQIKDKCKYKDGFYADTVYHWYKNGKPSSLEIVANRTAKIDECNDCNGTIIRYYENGQMSEKFTAVNSAYVDSAKTWFENGKLQSVGFYANGKREGTRKQFEENGSYKIENYKADSLWGKYIEHIVDSNNTQTIVGQFVNGKPIGIWDLFDKDSVKFQTEFYDSLSPIKVLYERKSSSPSYMLRVRQ